MEKEIEKEGRKVVEQSIERLARKRGETFRRNNARLRRLQKEVVKS